MPRQLLLLQCSVSRSATTCRCLERAHSDLFTIHRFFKVMDGWCNVMRPAHWVLSNSDPIVFLSLETTFFAHVVKFPGSPSKATELFFYIFKFCFICPKLIRNHGDSFAENFFSAQTPPCLSTLST